jgi:hypothetical protein
MFVTDIEAGYIFLLRGEISYIQSLCFSFGSYATPGGMENSHGDGTTLKAM